MSARRPPSTAVERAVKSALSALEPTLAELVVAFPGAAWALGVPGSRAPQTRTFGEPGKEIDAATMSKPLGPKV